MNGRGYVKWWMRALSLSSIMKTTTRNAAEHSLHRPICNLALIAYTHFIPIEKLSAVKMFEHEYQKNLRHERHQLIQAKVTEKVMAENAKHQLRIDANSGLH